MFPAAVELHQHLHDSSYSYQPPLDIVKHDDICVLYEVHYDIDHKYTLHLEAGFHDLLIKHVATDCFFCSILSENLLILMNDFSSKILDRS